MTRDKGGVLEVMDNGIRSLASAEQWPRPISTLFIGALSLTCWYAIFALIRAAV